MAIGTVCSVDLLENAQGMAEYGPSFSPRTTVRPTTINVSIVGMLQINLNPFATVLQQDFRQSTPAD